MQYREWISSTEPDKSGKASMAEYQYRGIPLTPTVGRDLVWEYLTQQTGPVKRSDLIKYAEAEHKNRGGTGGGDPTNSVKRALNGLIEEQKVIPTGALGYYSLASGQARSSAVDNTRLPIATEQIGGSDSIIPKETIGVGAELVYVYYDDARRELAELKGNNVWPCKIGFTAGHLSSRILAQTTGMARLPIVGLVIKTDDGRSLERALHIALDQAERRDDEAIGTEWFLTSPDRVKLWYQTYSEAVTKLRVDAP
jgi:hypothetical protein